MISVFFKETLSRIISLTWITFL